MHYYVVMSNMKRLKNSQQRRVSLGKAIRHRREAMDCSQEAFAEKVDCHRNYVSLVERGQQNITVDMLGRFAVILECSIAELMEGAKL